MNYSEQVERAERYFARIGKTAAGTGDLHAGNWFADDLVTFFMHCYHIKDWLKNDSSYSKHTNGAIEQHINDTLALSLSADICNGTKHMRLKDEPRSGAEPTLGPRHVSLAHEDGGDSTVSVSMTIDHDGLTYDALEVARDALNAWRKFI